MQAPDDSIRTRLRAALPPALRTGDAITVAAVRSALAAIENAEAIAVTDESALDLSEGDVAGARPGLGAGDAPRRRLAEGEVLEIVRSEIAERREAAAGYERAGRSDHAGKLVAEANVLAAYLGHR